MPLAVRRDEYPLGFEGKATHWSRLLLMKKPDLWSGFFTTAWFQAHFTCSDSAGSWARTFIGAAYALAELQNPFKPAPCRAVKWIGTAAKFRRNSMVATHKYSAECDIPIITAVTLSWKSTPSVIFVVLLPFGSRIDGLRNTNHQLLRIGQRLCHRRINALSAHKKSPFQYDQHRKGALLTHRNIYTYFMGSPPNSSTVENTALKFWSQESIQLFALNISLLWVLLISDR